MWLLTLRLILGVVFLVLGFIGLLVPVMPQVIFFVLAALMFFPKHRRLNKMLDRGERKMPRPIAWLRRIGIGHPDQECGAGPIPADSPSVQPAPAYEPPANERAMYPE